jgi:pyruvate dehydrogenase E1 component alpha subunit
MRCPTHLSIGEEAIGVGVCAHLNKTDAVFSHHRNHAHYLAMHGDIGEMLAEIYGKVTGCCRGNGGSMHLSSPQNGFIAASSIVGGSLPIAVGAALSFKLRKLPCVAVAFFGDGAVGEGVFHESLNFASLHNLPIVFVCENNFYAVLSKLEARHKNLDIFSKAFAYKIPGVRVDGNDVEAVYKTAKEAVEKVRRGEGPILIEAQTYRWKGHVGPENDHDAGHRSRQEVEDWMLHCPIKKLEEKMFEAGLMTKIDKENIVAELNIEISKAVEFAKNSPFPIAEDLLKYVYAV